MNLFVSDESSERLESDIYKLCKRDVLSLDVYFFFLNYFIFSINYFELIFYELYDIRCIVIYIVLY